MALRRDCAVAWPHMLSRYRHGGLVRETNPVIEPDEEAASAVNVRRRWMWNIRHRSVGVQVGIQGV